MRIVIATPVLYRESSPFNHLFKDIIGSFLDANHEIIRLVAVENKNDFAFKYGYNNPSIKYKLFKSKSTERSNILARFIRDSFTNIREAIAILKLRDVDVLFEDVSYSSFWAVSAAKLRKMKVVAMLQDVWPDNAVQSHIIREDSFLYKFFEMWQRYVYKNADKLICISDDIKDFIVSKGVDPNKIDVIYNWGYSDEIVDIAWEDNEFVKKYNLKKDVFYAVYAGNIGKMQNVEVIIKAAKELLNRKDIQFLIVGEGARENIIKEMASNLENVTVLPMQPSEMAPHIYSAAGVNIIPLVPGGTKTAMPSKTGIVLSCGKPTIFMFGDNSTFSKKVQEHGVGASLDANDYIGLKESIIDIASSNLEKNYSLFLDMFTKKHNTEMYVDAISNIKKKKNAKDKLKILLYSPLTENIQGGIAKWTDTYIKECNSVGMTIDLVNCAAKGKRAINPEATVSLKDELVRTIGIFSELRKKIKNNPDVAHINTSCGPLGIVRDSIVIKMLKKKNIKTVVHFHCDISFWVKNKISTFFLGEICKDSDLRIVLCKNSAVFLKQKYNVETVFVPNFVEESSIVNEHEISDDCSNIIFVGGIQPDKGCNEIFETARLKQTKKFILIGQLDTNVDVSNISNNVKIMGIKPHDEVLKYLDCADVFLFPSHSEGFSLALAEAMSRGLPVIATDVGANADMIENNGGIIVPVNSAKAISEALDTLDNPLLRKKMSKWNIDKVLNKYISTEIIQVLKNIYFSVVE